MPGRRMVHEQMCTSKKFSQVSAEAERLWTRILTKTDDNGNFHGSPAVIRGQCLSQFDVSIDQVQVWIEELLTVGLIAAYDSGGETYVHIIGFFKYQILRKDRQKAVVYPAHPSSLDVGGEQPSAFLDDEPTEDTIPMQNQENTMVVNGKPLVVNCQPLTTDGCQLTAKEKLSKDKLSEVKSSSQPGYFPTKADRKALRILYGRISGGKHIGGKQLDVDLDKACEKYSFDAIMACLEKWLEQRRGNPKAFTYSYPLRWFFSDDLPAMAEIEQALDDDRREQEQAVVKAQDEAQRVKAANEASIARQQHEVQEHWTDTAKSVPVGPSFEELLNME